MKRIIIGLITGLVLSCSGVIASVSEVPQTTLEIAKKAGFGENRLLPESKLVRVGIGTNNFSSYEWSGSTIYVTDEFEIYNNKTLIGTFDSSSEINISMVGKIFVLKEKDGTVIEKVSGPIRFITNGFIGIKDLKRAGKNALYRGKIELISSPKEGKYYTVNELELEEYLKGVVPNEMPVSFGLEALKAQAVAARNYVLSPRIKANPNYDVVDSVASQVYFGVNTERELSDRAVWETCGIVALDGWDLILAQYSSTAGGYTESFENAFSDPVTKKFPSNPKSYLKATPDYEDFGILNTEEKASEFYKSKPDSFDKKSSYFRWEREWNGQEIQDEVQNNIANQSATGFITPAVSKEDVIGIIKEIKVTRRGNSGKIIELEIITENATYTVQKELVIRRLFTNQGKALPSANVVFEHEYNENGDLIYVKAYGGGFGHGVGMSQYGAGYMGKELYKNFDEILKHYYNGVTLATVPSVISSADRNTTKTFYTKSGKGLLVTDNKYKANRIDLNINGNDITVSLNPDQRYNIVNISENLKIGMNTIKFYYPDSKGGIKFYIELCSEDE